jgi:hypothetical protein
VLYTAFLDDAVTEEAGQIGVRRCVKKGDVASLITALRELTGSDIGEPTP